MFLFFFLFLNENENSYAQNADQYERIVVAYDPGFPPFQYEENGIPKGFSIEIMNEIANVEGFEIDLIAMSKQEAVKALQNGLVDVILNMHFIQQYGKIMEFSEPIYVSSIGILVNKDDLNKIESITDLSNRVISIERETIEYEFMRNIRRVKYNVTSNQENSFKLLIDGRADAFVGDRLTAQYLMEAYQVEDTYEFVSSNVLPIEYTFATQKENYQLLTLLNRGLRTIKSDGTYTNISEKWFINNDPLMERLKKVVNILAGLIVLAIFIFLIGLRWNRQLQMLVDKKTEDLSKLNKSLEYQVQQTETSYLFQKQILDSSPRGIVTCDHNGKITSFNPKAKLLSGTMKDVINLNFQEVPLLQFLLSKNAGRISEDKYYVEETFWTRSDQKEFYLRYYIYPLYGFENKTSGFILTFEDHTAERKLREQIYNQEKHKTLSRVVAGIAHEIRNPLTSIKTFVELIPRKMNNERFQKEIATYVPNEINRLNRLIEGLIDYARPQSVNKERIDASKLVDECVILFERTIANKGLNLQTDITKGLWIEVDRDQLKQVIINFIINSIDAMVIKNQSHLTISITAYQHEGNVVIEVSDDGVGMEEEEIRRAFEPFYTTKPKGTGLGLAISEQYVQENEGTLQIKSNKGVGTTMIVRFKKKGVENG
ncbi:hypothetical protein BKP35_18120 [Anaerobacillus arseniciselenatis]|uniref:histidine kinase n=1 Tax=Anaerobacillus arseniciselenatis TaxID=85682 RepID=A0A1S2L778_9BACI|nr:hypothetical protein BKP35_18120 [Anaerobacillus arseniciselenatis]